MSEIFIEILNGMMHLHSKDIIHRDLHPGYILLKMGTNGNCIKITDFGFVKVHDNNKQNTGDIEMITYSAPEVLDCEKYDTRADIYSLGVNLQELFDIEVNSDYENNGNLTSLLKSKYENAKDLSIEMTNEIYCKRPDCEEIINRRKKWALNESEFSFREGLNILLDISEDNRSYAQNIIVSKLSNIIESFAYLSNGYEFY